jgi:STE24 endopeptidase
MNWLLIIITVASLFVAGLRSLIDWLNWKRSETSRLPEEFEGLYTPEKFEQSKAYLVATTKERLLERAVWTLAGLAFLWAGGFGALDSFVRGFGHGPIVTGLLFFLSLGLLSEILSLPFGYYSTFVVEEKFGFNRSTLGTFVSDHVKGWVLGILLGGPILAGLLWFFQAAGSLAWAYAWAFLAVTQLVIGFLAPVLLMPLFNKFTPLPAGDLKGWVKALGEGQRFFHGARPLPPHRALRHLGEAAPGRRARGRAGPRGRAF